MGAGDDDQDRATTATFLFTDIEGSTRLEQTLGSDAYVALRERHRVLLRAAFAAHGGAEEGTEGDSFFVTFADPRAAIGAAIDLQRALAGEAWPGDVPIRVRVGIHTGQARRVGGSLAGIDINRAARIGAAAHGGQVVVSATTRVLVGDRIAPGVTWLDLGEHRLRDLEQPERLSQLRVDGLPETFPPLRGTLVAGDLPLDATSFVGREQELTEIGALLADTRLLTLTGPGGTGKTRLSIETARRALAWFPDGAWFVPLETIGDPSLVPGTVAQRLRLVDRGGSSPIDRLREHLQDRVSLLLLDNFEQVMAAGPFVGELLAAAPRLKVIVTSREALRISGEQEYPVPPLTALDPASVEGEPDGLVGSEAVMLFLERARAVRPGYQPSGADARAVAEICYRLDGLPLAIELAAARIRLLSPQAMVARLGHSLSLLAGGARDLPTRQQTLRGAIAWSHELLGSDDRQLFACVSVFAGRADLDAIEGICGGPDGDVLERVASLVDKSLVRRRDTSDGEPRFAMFEAIREFAAGQLAVSGHRDETRARHARCYLERVTELRGAAETGDHAALDRLEQDHDDLRAAIGWALESGDLSTAVGLAGGLWRFWQKRGYLAEGLTQLERVLALAGPDAPDELRLVAHEAHGGLAYWLGDQERARASYQEVVDIRRRQGDPRALAQALYDLAFTYLFRAQLEEGEAILEEAGGLMERLGDELGLARVRWARANLEWTTGDPGRVPSARAYALMALETFEREDDRFMTAWATYTAALGSLVEHDRPEARRLLTRSLRLFQEAGDVSGYTLVLDSVAALLDQEGDPRTAARLAGQVTTLEKTTGTGLNPLNRGYYDHHPERLAADPATADAYADGARMAVDDAVALALLRLEASGTSDTDQATTPG